MSIEQLELILSDTYQMDVSFPAIFGHRKEFMQSSYSIARKISSALSARFIAIENISCVSCLI